MFSRRIDVLRLRIRSLFRRARVDQELERELRFHIDQQTEENVARGMSPDEARRAAFRTFGGVESTREAARDARGVHFVDDLLRDLRHALRGLLREPLLLFAATTSIALGATGNIAVFSLAKEMLLATPDVRGPEDLVRIRVSGGSHVTYRRWVDLEASGALEHVTGYSIERQINFFNGDATVSLTPLLVAANFFDVTGTPLERGRAFSAEEARAERDPHVAVISHAFWQRELGADSAVVGRAIRVNGESYTILGVLAPRLRSVTGLGLAPPLYLPLNRSLIPELRAPHASIVQLIGRLKPGQTLEEGRAAVDAVDRRLARLEGDTLFAGVQEFARLGGVSDTEIGRTVGGFFALLSVASCLVLLIACANVAGLLIARSTTRRREVAIRLAIGGTRRRLLQQFLVEGFWLALLGTGCGLALSSVLMRVVNGLTLPVPLPVELHLGLDMPVLLCALGLVIVSTMLSALLPALGATRFVLSPALKREEQTYGGRRFTARGVLLAGQVMISTVLLVTAFLFVRNLARTHDAKPGFEIERGLVAQIGFVQGKGTEEQRNLLQRVVARLQAVPGVVSAAYTSAVPLTIYSWSSSSRTARVGARPPQHVEYGHSAAGPEYFATMGIRLLQGREFAPTDRLGTANVVIVNEEFVRLYSGGTNPVGHRLQLVDDYPRANDSTVASEPVDFEIVGLVANSKYQTLGEKQRAALYFPLLQQREERGMAFVVMRTRGDPSALIATVRDAIGEVDRSVAIEVKATRTALAFALLPSQIGAAVFGGLGVLGLILATFGLYAIVAYNVNRRVGEIAIRGALGATSGKIVRLVIRDAAVLVGSGILLGLAIATFVTRLVTVFLVDGLSPMDPASFVGTGLLFLIVAVVASWFPARHAASVSPVVAMRLE